MADSTGPPGYQLPYKKKQESQVKFKELTEIFKSAGVKSDLQELKLLLIAGKDYSRIMKQYEDDLPKRQFQLINKVLQSPELEKWREKVKLEASSQKKDMLDKIFSHQDIKHDLRELKQALLYKKSLKQILEGYEDQFGGKQMRAINLILNSSELQNLLKQNSKSEDENQISKLFAHIKADTGELQKLLLSSGNVDLSLEVLQAELPGKIFNQIKVVLNSDELKRILSKKKTFKKGYADKMQELFKKQGIKQDLKELIQAFCLDQPIAEIIEVYELNLSGREFKALQKIIKSPEFDTILKESQIQYRSQIFDNFFQKIKADLTKLKEAVVKQFDIEPVLKQYEDDLKGSDFKQIKKIVGSEQFIIFYKKEFKRNETKERNLQLKSGETSLSVETLLEGDEIKNIVQKCNNNNDIKENELHAVNKLLESKDIQVIITQLKENEQEKLIKRLQDTGVDLNYENLVKSLLENEDISVIMGAIKDQVREDQYAAIESVVESYLVTTNRLLKTQEKKQEQLSEKKLIVCEYQIQNLQSQVGQHQEKSFTIQDELTQQKRSPDQLEKNQKKASDPDASYQANLHQTETEKNQEIEEDPEKNDEQQYWAKRNSKCSRQRKKSFSHGYETIKQQSMNNIQQPENSQLNKQNDQQKKEEDHLKTQVGEETVFLTYSPAEYIITKLKQQNLWDFDQEAEEQSFIRELNKSPQLFDLLIQASLGKSRQYRNFLTQIKEDNFFKNLILKSKKYPFHHLYQSIKKQSRKDSILFNLGVQVQCWQIRPILAETNQLFRKFLFDIIKSENENTENILIKMSELIFDVLIRKGNLPQKITQINQIGAQTKHELLKQVSIYDFITLFSKLVEKLKLPYFGLLLHKNCLPLPVISSTMNDGLRKYYSNISLLENILIENKVKLVVNAGTAMSEKKGKTELIANIFNIDYQSCSTLKCDFHIGCVSFYTNLSSTTTDQSIIIADIHGQIKENLQDQNIKKILANASLVILHMQAKEQNEKQTIISDLRGYTDARFLIAIRDSPFSTQKNDKSSNTTILPKMTEKNGAEKLSLLKNFKASLISQLSKINLVLDYKNLVQQNKKKVIQEEQKFQNNILLLMQQNQKRGELWKVCFPNLCQFRDLYTMELNMYDLERQIKYNKKDERHTQYTYIKNKYEERKKNSQETKHFLTSVSEIYFKNFLSINVKTLNHKIVTWKKKFTEELERQIVDMKAKLEKKLGDTQQLIKNIEKLENDLGQFDVSADTLLQEILIVANNQKKNNSDYEKCLKNYYKELYKTLNPINLIDGNTLLFGNSLLKSFFEEISKQIPSGKKIYVVSVIGIQSSAKSTLMNYLFNCRFETSAGRCTKGVYFTISQTQNEVFVVVDTEGLMSVCARDRVFDIQIASFTFLVSDLIIINNKGQINTPIRELLGVCTYALQQLNQRKPGKQRSKVFFAIRDQSCAGVQKQKSMLSDIINSLKSHSDLANFEDFLDFSSQDIYPLESAFNQIATNIDANVQQKPNYCFSESIIALRSKIISFLNTKEPFFANIKDFYNQSEKKWRSIRDCGEHIFNFQEVLQIRIKKSLKEFQQELLNAQFKQIENLVKQSVDQIQKINNNEELKIYQSMVMSKIGQSFCFVKDQMAIQGKKTKGAKNEWIKDLILDSQREFNYKIIMNREFIQNLYKQKMKKIKDNIFEQKISQIISSILKSDRDLDSIKNQYDKECKKLFQQDQFNFDDTELTLKGILEKQVCEIIKISLKKSSITLNDDEKFYYYFKLNFFGYGFARQRSQQIKAVKIVQDKFIILQKQLKSLNEKYEPIVGQDNKKFILEYELKVINMIEVIEQDIQKFTKSWKVYKLIFQSDKFKSDAFSIFCQFIPKLIVKRNRNSVKTKEIEKKKKLIINKWQQIERNFIIKGNAEKVTEKIIQQLEISIAKQVENSAKRDLMSSLSSLINKFNPVKMIQEVMRLTFRSTQYSKKTWLRCFKVIYDFNRFMQEQILYEQNQYLQLSHKLQIQKDNVDKLIQQRFSKIADKIPLVQDFRKLGDAFNIDVKCFQYDENIKIFNVIHTILEGRFCVDKRELIKQNILKKMTKQKNIFDGLEKELKEYVKNNIGPQIIGCQSRCPFCTMKCKLSRGHENGHKCVEGTHLQTCFAGFRYVSSKQRSKCMCFTEQQIKYKTYQYENQSYQAIQYVEKFYAEWLDHFKSGPYQDKLNELNCERIWANIGDVLLKTKYKHGEIINEGVREEEIRNPLTEEDVRDWINQGIDQKK